jgi:fatty acid synthase subunit beta
VLNHLHANAPLPGSPEQIATLVETQVAQVAQTTPPAALTRGCATIPLPGIDVPFHSSSLLPGVPGFRRCLLDLIDSHALDPKCLVGRYIPNLTARPFELSKEYFELVYKLTGSVALEGVLREVRLSTLLRESCRLIANPT